MPSNETNNDPTKLSEAPMNDEHDSVPRSEDREEKPVLDFLYHDARRIASFLAQFETYGVPQLIKASESVGRSRATRTALSASGEVPLVVRGEAALDRTTTDDEKDEAERTFDPLWTNAQKLRDYLDDSGLIQRDITKARLGQFVIASGELAVLNAALLQKMFGSGAIGKLAVQGAVNNAREKWRNDPNNAALKGAQRTAAEKKYLAAAEQNFSAGMEVLPHYPYSPQCTIKGSNFSVWSSLNADGMLDSAADLSLKHGTEIPGTWHLLGILDALPSPIPAQIVIPVSDTPRHMGDAIRNTANLGRTILGRAPEAYGMTALLLFREVSG